MARFIGIRTKVTTFYFIQIQKKILLPAPSSLFLWKFFFTFLFIKSRPDFGFLPNFLFIDPDGKKKIFSSRSKLHRHLLTHQDKEHQNRCPKCCALFQNTLAEITHNCTASRQRVLIFHCPMCQYNCNKAVALKSHMLTHQPQVIY